MDAFANVLDMRARWLLRFFEDKLATKHFHAMQHPLILSIDPGEHWVLVLCRSNGSHSSVVIG
jgi:hypothetical protein